MKFPYSRYGAFYRPVIPVIFKHDSHQFHYEVLIDTGADISIIHSDIAALLNIKLEDGTKYQFGGVTGKEFGHLHHVDILIGGINFSDVPVLFAKNIVSQGYGILGHEGLFSRVKLGFEYGKKEIELVPKVYS